MIGGSQTHPDVHGALLVPEAANDSRGVTWLISQVTSRPSLSWPVGLIALLVVLAVAGPVLWPGSPTAVDPGAALSPPSWAHPMGTDSVGRDVFARFLAGARISLLVGLTVALFAGLVGGALGVISGMAGGATDNVLMRMLDVLLAFPPLLFAMAVTVGLGVGLATAVLGVAIATVPVCARVVRSEAVRLRSMGFVEAAVALGAGRRRVVLRHVVPHLGSTLAIQMTTAFGYAILAVAALGFIGLGAQVPTPEWGSMITEGLDNVLTGAWWICVFPGLGILVAVTAASLLADAMVDLLDPRRL